VNMSEFTKKLLASAALVLTTKPELIDAITLEDKNAMKNWVSKRCKVMADKIHEGGFPPCEYCMMLPYDPAELMPAHPQLYQRASIDGCFVPAELDQAALAKVENSYQCRNTLAAGRIQSLAVCEMNPMSQPTNMMQQMQMMMMTLASMNRGNQHGDQEDLHLEFANARSRKRGPAMMADALAASASRSQSDLDQLSLQVNSRDQQLRRAVTFDGQTKDARSGEACVQPSTANPPLAEDKPMAVTPPPKKSVETSAQNPSTELRIQEANTPNTDLLMEAMITRDAERAEESKKVAAEKRAAVKAAKAAAAGDEAGSVVAVVAPAPTLAEGEKVAGKKKLPAKAVKPAPSPKAMPTPVKAAKAKHQKSCIAHESSRCQYLARTGGVGSLGSKVFSYKDGEMTVSTAKTMAQKWLKEYLATNGKKK